LLVDEAQEMSSSTLSELRLLSSTELDSRSILTTVLAGDHRLANRLEEADLLPIASRIRARLRTEALTQLPHFQNFFGAFLGGNRPRSRYFTRSISQKCQL
jgi:type II secretory pathway predicted ATPase ExeA